MAGSKKATFSLRLEVLAAIEEAVAEGAASSKNALVERAIAGELRAWPSRKRRDRWAQAAKAPLFLGDVEDIDAAFPSADAETARSIDRCLA